MKVVYRTIRERLEIICLDNPELIKHIELTEDEHQELASDCRSPSNPDYQANMFMGVKIIVVPGETK